MIAAGECGHDVLAELDRRGFEKIRQAHGYVFQHLIGGPRSVTALAGLLGVSQQAASKSVAELVGLDYLTSVRGADRRSCAVALSPRGLACITAARQSRARIERRLLRKHGDRAIRRAKALLAAVLMDLGGATAVRARRVREPR